MVPAVFRKRAFRDHDYDPQRHVLLQVVISGQARVQYAWFAALSFLAVHATAQIRRADAARGKGAPERLSGLRRIREAHAAPHPRRVVRLCRHNAAAAVQGLGLPGHRMTPIATGPTMSAARTSLR